MGYQTHSHPALFLTFVAVLGCPTKPNPGYVGSGETGTGETGNAGDGDAGDGDPGDGDPGDGDPGDGDPGDGDGDAACTTHTECVDTHNENWMCGCGGTCVNALTSECQLVKWPNDTPQDNVVFIGSIMPTSPPFDTLVLPLQNSMQLALSDFNKETQLPGGQKVAWVACDSVAGSQAVAVAQHLVDNVCVPAIVGPVFSEATIAVVENVTIPAGVFTITPTATSKKITNLVDDDLVWRPIASDVYQAEAIADRLEAISQPGDNVVFVNKNDEYGNSLSMDAYANTTGVDITDVFAYDLQFDPTDPIVDVADHIADTLFTDGGANPPEIIVLIGTSEVQAFMLGYLQAISVMQPPPFPRFLVSHGAIQSMVDVVKDPLVVDDDMTQWLLYGVLEGVQPIIFDEQNFEAFNTRYMIEFDDTNSLSNSSLAYDSALVTMFGIAAIPDGQPITGAEIAAQMAKLTDTDGVAISFGPEIDTTFIETTVNILSVGGTVDLKGVSGELDFDLATGDVRTDLLGWQPEAINDNVDTPGLVPKRIYVLDPEPATQGTWMDLP